MNTGQSANLLYLVSWSLHSPNIFKSLTVNKNNQGIIARAKKLKLEGRSLTAAALRLPACQPQAAFLSLSLSLTIPNNTLETSPPSPGELSHIRSVMVAPSGSAELQSCAEEAQASKRL
jgi:hypothetical protein